MNFSTDWKGFKQYLIAGRYLGVALNRFYNIAFVNSERWLAKSRVDITLCQHGKFPATLLLKFFVLYYKRNIKHFFRIDIQLYQHSWKLEKLEIVWKHSALRASCFHTISRFSNFHSCWYNCTGCIKKKVIELCSALARSLYNLQKSFFRRRKDQAFSFRLLSFLWNLKKDWANTNQMKIAGRNRIFSPLSITRAANKKRKFH